MYITITKNAIETDTLKNTINKSKWNSKNKRSSGSPDESRKKKTETQTNNKKKGPKIKQNNRSMNGINGINI